jgi:hypothetical protein
MSLPLLNLVALFSAPCMLFETASWRGILGLFPFRTQRRPVRLSLIVPLPFSVTLGSGQTIYARISPSCLVPAKTAHLFYAEAVFFLIIDISNCGGLQAEGFI